MTKKKRERKERKARQARQDSTKRRKSEEVPDLAALPDPRAMERMNANIGKLLEEQEFDSIEQAQAFLDRTLLEGGGLLPEAPAPNTPLEKAQDLVYEALETESPRKRIQLARRALKISGDCADAYVLLAEESAKSLEEARDLYQKGVEAGERALGRETFEEDAGSFWGILETRPYTRALWAFRKEGDTMEATEALEEAIETNPYVTLYLLGHKSVPSTPPDLMSLGDESEAVSYVAGALTQWLRTPSALEWLRGNVDERLLAELQEEE